MTDFDKTLAALDGLEQQARDDARRKSEPPEATDPRSGTR
jgi:hypothetical protein